MLLRDRTALSHLVPAAPFCLLTFSPLSCLALPMLLLLSPAKSLNYDTPVPAHLPHTLPAFSGDSATLIALLRGHSPQTLAALMKLSDPLAALNVARYAAWRPEAGTATGNGNGNNSHGNARQALLAFNGGVYAALDAHTLSHADLQWAQQHLMILSGLYGVLRPLDLVQPHRLEMGTRLATPAGQSLYQFWGTRIAEHLNTALAASAPASGTAPVVLNLASQEYFRAVDRTTLKARVVDCVFEDWKFGAYKVIGIHAKRARGLMARHCTVQRVTTPQALTAFAAEGYAFDSSASSADRMVFRRRSA